jgi:hypothetical protein
MNRTLKVMGLIGLFLLAFTGYWLLRVLVFGKPPALLDLLLFSGVAGGLVVVVRCWPRRE